MTLHPSLSGPAARRPLALLFPLILSMAVAGCSPSAADQSAPTPPAVGVAPALSRQVVLWNDFNGRIEAVESVALRPRVSGYIQKISYKEGQMVQRGDVLFEIDPRSYQAALAQAEAELVRARTRVGLARSELSRSRTLADVQAVSTEMLEQRRAAFEQAEADVLSAQAAVNKARLDLDFTRVRAPITGRAGRALVTTGNLVTGDGPDSVLTTLVSMDPVHVHFDSDERTYLRQAQMTRNGQRPDESRDGVPVQVGLLGESDHPHTGRVDFIDNRVDPRTGTIRGRATLPNPDGLLTPGLYARVRLQATDAFEAVLIDDTAILTDQDRKYVYVVDDSNTAQRRDIQLGSKTDGLRIVEQGLAPGDRVIVNGIQKVFFPGMPVTAQEATMEPVALAQPSPASH